MSFISRYFDSLTEPMFKADAEGRPLFFPLGIWARGRVLPDEAAAAALRAKVRRAYMLFFLVLIPVVAGGAPVFKLGSVWPGAMMGLVAGVGLQAYILSLTRGLPRSDEQLTLREAQRTQARLLGRGWLRALLGISLVLMLSGLAAMVLDPAHALWTGLFCTSFFGLLAVVFWRQMRMLRPATA